MSRFMTLTGHVCEFGQTGGSSHGSMRGKSGSGSMWNVIRNGVISGGVPISQYSPPIIWIRNTGIRSYWMGAFQIRMWSVWLGRAMICAALLIRRGRPSKASPDIHLSKIKKQQRFGCAESGMNSDLQQHYMPWYAVNICWIPPPSEPINKMWKKLEKRWKKWLTFP